VRGAGDGNRTRTISLGIGSGLADNDSDLAIPMILSDRDCPLITLANGTLMAR